MKYALTAKLALLLVAAMASAQQGTPQPKFVTVSAIDPGKKTITLADQRFVPVKMLKFITENVIINGQATTVTKAIEEEKMVTENFLMLWSSTSNTASDVAGNPLTDATLFQRLKAGDGVLTLPKGQTC